MIEKAGASVLTVHGRRKEEKGEHLKSNKYKNIYRILYFYNFIIFL